MGGYSSAMRDNVIVPLSFEDKGVRDSDVLKLSTPPKTPLTVGGKETKSAYLERESNGK